MTSTHVPDSVTFQAFRDAMATVASPVAVVTAMDGHRPHGTTVSAFASLSLTPPMVLTSLDNRSQLLTIIRRTGRFGLNILGAHQADLADVFARSGPDKFDGVTWSPSQELPRLPGSAAWIAAEVDDYVGAGDHTVLLAHVHAAEQGKDDLGIFRPLTYHHRSFGTHTPLAS
ncbi:flavin reductase family protein [Streptomyces sp. NBC_01361]|uniref:flavin reductase family protein n=1 Tax=Streptomyces sp. NBC_01361 TaxID=2903838 RepID=UPI002E2EA838|nr:flavin reductase family protein [Streptomyces sp. NBC_01361]